MSATVGRVLVVDDDERIRELIRVNLELEGFQVMTARDGAECLELVHGDGAADGGTGPGGDGSGDAGWDGIAPLPDVITLDARMPRLDGLSTAARLRADSRTEAIPLALVSASTASAGHAATASLVDVILDKPFEPAVLVRLVRALLPRSDAGPGTTRHPHGLRAPQLLRAVRHLGSAAAASAAVTSSAVAASTAAPGAVPGPGMLSPTLAP